MQHPPGCCCHHSEHGKLNNQWALFPMAWSTPAPSLGIPDSLPRAEALGLLSPRLSSPCTAGQLNPAAPPHKELLRVPQRHWEHLLPCPKHSWQQQQQGRVSLPQAFHADFCALCPALEQRLANARRSRKHKWDSRGESEGEGEKRRQPSENSRSQNARIPAMGFMAIFPQKAH